MRRLLVVSPHFPPVNAPDLHRVRTSLAHYAEFGWQPFVLAIDPAALECYRDDRLTATLPAGVAVTRARAIPLALTGRVGIRTAGLRALGHLYVAGARLIQARRIDLVFISTTMFPAMTLGRLWKARCGVPYVLDMQDPWHSEYTGMSAGPRSRKARLARWLHAKLEPFAMRQVDGLVAVSDAYISTLRRRYPWIAPERCAVVPFGASEQDFAVARRIGWRNDYFRPGDGAFHGVYVGAGGHAMRTAARIACRALRHLAARQPEAGPVRLSFIGTDYALPDRARPWIAPEAAAEGVADRVREWPARAPYFEALRVLLDANFLLLLGSADAQYNPSKVATWILARRPIVAVLHEDSPAVALLRAAGVESIVTFSSDADVEPASVRLAGLIARLREQPADPPIQWAAVAPFLARDLTRRQCAVFDSVLDARADRVLQRLSCTG